MLYERHSPKKMKWIGFGGKWGTNRSQSDFFDKKGLKTTKSAFETRYMTYDEQLLYQHGKKKFSSIGSPKWPLLGPKQPQIQFFIENDQ